MDYTSRLESTDPNGGGTHPGLGPNELPNDPSQLAKQLGVADVAELVWGPPQRSGDRVVLPMARVIRRGRWMGQAGPPPAEQPTGERRRWAGGRGGGGAIAVEPVGALEVTPTHARIVPAVNVGRMVPTMVGLIAAIVGLVMVGRLVTELRKQAGNAGTRILSPSLQLEPEVEIKLANARIASPDVHHLLGARR